MFQNKRVLITGGSSGIGFAAAEKFLEGRARVMITGRREEKLRQAAQALDNPNLSWMVWDITDFSILDQSVEACAARLGGIDILVNNAGLALPVDFHGDFFGSTEAMWDTVFDTNLKGSYFLCQRVIRHMLDQHIQGNIVNVCSETAFRHRQDTPYPLSKTGLRQMTESMGIAFIKKGIVVNGIAPGAVYTELQKKEGLIPARQIADMICFLASPLGRIIVGDTLIADRGERFGLTWTPQEQAEIFAQGDGYGSDSV